MADTQQEWLPRRFVHGKFGFANQGKHPKAARDRGTGKERGKRGGEKDGGGETERLGETALDPERNQCNK